MTYVIRHVSCNETFDRYGPIQNQPDNFYLLLLYVSRITPSDLYRFKINLRNYESFYSNTVKAPWTVDRPIARSPPTQDSTAQKNADTRPCLERD